MSFARHMADRWHEEVPGARWFKTDLHVHTIDDHPGRRTKMPASLSGSPDDPEVLSRYAKLFLRSVVESGVQVVGLTPHSPRVGTAPETSAVWKIVEEWNTGVDDDEVPFREKIYAIFPGFEPNLKDGREGLHLQFLFDPEIGRDCYLKLFELVMGGVSPWVDGTLRISNKSAEEVFDELRKFRERECPQDAGGQRPWEHLVLAPHIDGPKGLLGGQKSQILQFFDHGEVQGLELGDGKLPADAIQDRPWLPEGMQKYRQAFFHGSDAYSVDQIGQRHTWVKLASPRIGALRQAFIARDSRMRIGFQRDTNGELRAITDPPDVLLSQRPWLRRVAIRGEASFLGGRKDSGPRESHFDLSPDLTCIIGGSMTGKSTLLDGLRVHVGARLPANRKIREEVEARGRDRFLAGSPEVELDCRGSDPTAPLHERWPAVFYAQNELRRLVQESAAVEEILARLVPSETQGIEDRYRRLKELAGGLTGGARRLSALDEQAGDAEQAYERASKAKAELSAFSEAGVDKLHQAGRSRQAWQDSQQKADDLRNDLSSLLDSANAFDVPGIDGDFVEALESVGIDLDSPSLRGRWERMTGHLRSAKQELEAWVVDVRRVVEVVTTNEKARQTEAERALADGGFDASRLKEFQALNQQASLLASYEANLKETREAVAAAEKSFAALQEERKRLLLDQRAAFDRVMACIARDFEERIRASRAAWGDTRPLRDFLHTLAQKGITRWWNGLEEKLKPSAEKLIESIDGAGLTGLGMSAPVQETFRESMTKAKKRELSAIGCPDRYGLELRMDDGSYRRLDELSGGQRVSVLLSLLLETTDDRPLVIDQPEDELDNRFLFDTVLPALKKLKGRRQVIVATHNANIVVNGDADIVIQLEATANHGHVACAGAIEEPDVRNAIVRTVDGGADAFRLRRLKYGF